METFSRFTRIGIDGCFIDGKGKGDMLTRKELLHMRDMSFDDIAPEEIPDVNELDINVAKTKQEKIQAVLESGRNPYFIKSGSIIVKIGFASTSRTIEEALESLVQMKW